MSRTDDSEVPTVDTTACPECGSVAEVTERAVLESTDGAVEHVRVVCVARHWFLLPASALTSVSAAGRGVHADVRR